MANNTDLTVNIIGNAKDLLKKMEEANKVAKNNLKQHGLLEQKFQRTKKQQLQSEKREASAQFKIHKKHVSELQKMEKKALNPNERDLKRAEIIRKKLGG